MPQSSELEADLHYKDRKRKLQTGHLGAPNLLEHQNPHSETELEIHKSFQRLSEFLHTRDTALTQVCKGGHKYFPLGAAEHLIHHVHYLSACGWKCLMSDFLPAVPLHTLHRKIPSAFNSNIKDLHFMSNTHDKVHLFFNNSMNKKWPSTC